MGKVWHSGSRMLAAGGCHSCQIEPGSYLSLVGILSTDCLIPTCQTIAAVGSYTPKKSPKTPGRPLVYAHKYFRACGICTTFPCTKVLPYRFLPHTFRMDHITTTGGNHLIIDSRRPQLVSKHVMTICDCVQLLPNKYLKNCRKFPLKYLYVNLAMGKEILKTFQCNSVNLLEEMVLLTRTVGFCVVKVRVFITELELFLSFVELELLLLLLWSSLL